MMGGSHDTDKDQAYSWQRLRNLLLDSYDQIVVVSIAQPDIRRIPLSRRTATSPTAWSSLAVIPTGVAPNRRAHFVNLEAVPATKLEAQETARAIKAAIASTTEPDTWNRIQILEDEDNRFCNTAKADCSQPANGPRLRSFADPSIGWNGPGKSRPGGELRLPSARRIDPECPIVNGRKRSRRLAPFTATSPEGAIAHSDKRDGYQSTNEYPMLWSLD